MDPERQSQTPNPEPGYQPSTGRKLFMLVLCLLALAGVWVFYWFSGK